MKTVRRYDFGFARPAWSLYQIKRTAWLSIGVFGRPPRGLDFQRQYARKPARCQRITVSGLTIFKASSTPGASRYNPANSRRSMLVKVSRCGDLRRQDLCLQRRSRPEQSDQRQPNQAANISHQPRASPDSISLASRIEFPTMTAGDQNRQPQGLKGFRECPGLLALRG